MNEIIDSLLKRKSVRQYLDKNISESDVNLILDSAINAPSGGNITPYSIIKVTDKDILEKLSVSCDNQPFIKESKLCLVFLSDSYKWETAIKNVNQNTSLPHYGSFITGLIDTVIAAQNSVVAAESLGIGSCYIGDIVEKYEYHKELFNLPKYVFPVCLLVFGYPTESQINRKKPARFDRDYVVFENQYIKLDDQELKNMFEKRGLKDNSLFNYEKFINAFSKRKFETDFFVEMNRSVKEILKQFNTL
jgi:FMN reductase (NADPH)/FMN reductase [NAD(P)H]